MKANRDNRHAVNLKGARSVLRSAAHNIQNITYRAPFDKEYFKLQFGIAEK